ncbi:TraB/GumN family protein [Ottowia testudinis]|uniref:TraB/GumN family protein n=1 Tax=Ottowia testudinis TaxID=2816950 RepID=A0A975CEF4_9BURK|nr:TraB/GumN family protein [Ottowia testudinis]QTD44256.1 TraB/GumN family protein [Ottowia testudinis]
MLLKLLARAALIAWPIIAGLLAPSAWARDCLPEFKLPAAGQIQAAARAAEDRGFLWSIERDGRTSYLYGTLHVGKLAWLPGPRTRQALQASQVLALELDLTDDTTLKDASQSAKRSSSTAAPPPLLARMQRMAEDECLRWSDLEPLQPALQVATLMLAAARHDGLEVAYASELVLGGMARQSAMPVHALETVTEQFNALAPPDAAGSARQLERDLNDLQSGRALTVLRRLVEAWAQSDVATLQSYEQWCGCTDTEDDRALTRRLLDERNPRLAERIDALHTGGQRVFAAVGALHLIGDQGLPALLARHGYKVRALF